MRINIEDSLYADYRFKALVRNLGDEDRAVGMCVRFWRSAAVRWAHDELVSREQFRIEGFEPLAEVGLAEERESGFYAKGSENFEWYHAKVSAAVKAGRASAAARKSKFGSAQPKPNPRTTPERTFEQTPEHGQPEPRTLEPSSLLGSVPCSNEQESTPTEYSSAGASPPVHKNGNGHKGPTPDDLMALWNETRGPLPQVKALSADRRKKAKARLHDNPHLDFWRDIIERMSRSAFCRGERTDWQANFDWLLKPDTALKISEGKFDDARTSGFAAVDAAAKMDVDLGW